MEEVCSQCGDIGWDRQLTCCIKCQESTIHRYCMETMPNEDESVLDCISQSSKKRKRNQAGNKKAGNKSIKNFKKRSKKTKKNQIAAENKKTRKPRKNFKKTKKNKIAGQDNKSRNKKFLYHYAYTRAEPLICSVWTGSLNLWYNQESSVYRRLGGVSAYLSSKACEKVRNEAVRFENLVHLDMLPKSCVWPESFKAGLGPTDDNVALYFFPSLTKHEEVYDCLVSEMIHGGLAMRAITRNVELLVFASFELPPESRRFQGKLYLWGVFREKKATL